ncbi:MAG: hypothetical protein SGJ11_16580 [Phycisphaerae bacterium]|nr:hypothetical protein [Phycisphaerae bacterium]
MHFESLSLHLNPNRLSVAAQLEVPWRCLAHGFRLPVIELVNNIDLERSLRDEAKHASAREIRSSLNRSQDEFGRRTKTCFERMKQDAFADHGQQMSKFYLVAGREPCFEVSRVRSAILVVLRSSLG